MLHFPARHGPFHSVVWRAVYNPTRHISYSSPSLSTPPEGSPKLTNLTFESIGVRKPIAVALSSAFPHIRHPTETQTRLIPAILSGKDVLLKDETGSGKYVLSFSHLFQANLYDKNARSTAGFAQ